MSDENKSPFAALAGMTLGQVKSYLGGMVGVVKMQLRFEESLAALSSVLGQHALVHKGIMDLVNWHRDEYSHRPEPYPGDQVVVDEIRMYVSSYGQPIEKAVELAKEALSAKLMRIDAQRMLCAGMPMSIEDYAKLLE